MELDRKDKEHQAMQKYLDHLHQEEADKLRARKKEQQRLRTHLKTESEENSKRKEALKNQERILDQQVMEFQRSKEVVLNL